MDACITKEDWECADSFKAAGYLVDNLPFSVDLTGYDKTWIVREVAKHFSAHTAPIRVKLDQAVADSNAWQTVACFLAGLMIPVGRFDVRRLFQWVRSGKDLATIPTGDARKGAGDES